jgi:hypothetical protein
MKKKAIIVALALSAAVGAFGARAAAPAPTDADVGDAGSFGSRVIWLGVVGTGAVVFASDCTPVLPGLGPDDRCVTIDPSGPTAFAYADLGRVTLLANSTATLLCHWATANGSYVFFNPSTTAAATAEFFVRPTFRIESKVLQGPPFNGGIDTGIAGYFDQETLAPGAQQVRSVTTSRDCIAGLITKSSLINDYGLTPSQAAAFFQNPITIRAGVTGEVSGAISEGSIVFSTRLTGDHP